jgi:bifunctional ADP-heptose synthase (sugar kinase/adenylyltransferase)
LDICGAGDSFSAGAGVALTICRSPIEAARVGNLIASITIMKKGTGTASVEEARAAAEEMGW